MRPVLALFALWSSLLAPPEQGGEAPISEPAPIQLNPAPEPEGFTSIPEVDEQPFKPADPVHPDAPESTSADTAAPQTTPSTTRPTERELQPESGGPGRRGVLGPKRPPVWPPTWFSFGLGGSPSSFSVGAGITRFLIPYVGVRLEIRDDVIFGSNGTYNSFTATPVVTLLMLPRRHFSPFARGGFGLNAYSSRLGVYGQFLGGGGVLFRFLKRYTAEIGFDVVGDVPRDKYFDNFFCNDGGRACWLGLRPSVGFGVGFGSVDG